jgi:predicted AAA+ superfamily ATPase
MYFYDHKKTQTKDSPLIRKALLELTQWLMQINRKPFVLRGVRQSGTTWLVRELAKSQKKQLIEINFENSPELCSLFTSNDVKAIWSNLVISCLNCTPLMNYGASRR